MSTLMLYSFAKRSQIDVCISQVDPGTSLLNEIRLATKRLLFSPPPEQQIPANKQATIGPILVRSLRNHCGQPG